MAEKRTYRLRILDTSGLPKTTPSEIEMEAYDIYAALARVKKEMSGRLVEIAREGRIVAMVKCVAGVWTVLAPDFISQSQTANHVGAALPALAEGGTLTVAEGNLAASAALPLKTARAPQREDEDVPEEAAMMDA